MKICIYLFLFVMSSSIFCESHNLFINKVKVAEKNGTKYWDSFSGAPDLQIIVSKKEGNLWKKIFTSATYKNHYTIENTIVIANKISVGDEISITVIDIDIKNDDTLGSYVFSLSEDEKEETVSFSSVRELSYVVTTYNSLEEQKEAKRKEIEKNEELKEYKEKEMLLRKQKKEKNKFDAELENLRDTVLQELMMDIEKKKEALDKEITEKKEKAMQEITADKLKATEEIVANKLKAAQEIAENKLKATQEIAENKLNAEKKSAEIKTKENLIKAKITKLHSDVNKNLKELKKHQHFLATQTVEFEKEKILHLEKKQIWKETAKKYKQEIVFLQKQSTKLKNTENAHNKEQIHKKSAWAKEVSKHKSGVLDLQKKKAVLLAEIEASRKSWDLKKNNWKKEETNRTDALEQNEKLAILKTMDSLGKEKKHLLAEIETLKAFQLLKKEGWQKQLTSRLKSDKAWKEKVENFKKNINVLEKKQKEMKDLLLSQHEKVSKEKQHLKEILKKKFEIEEQIIKKIELEQAESKIRKNIDAYKNVEKVKEVKDPSGNDYIVDQGNLDSSDESVLEKDSVVKKTEAKVKLFGGEKPPKLTEEETFQVLQKIGTFFNSLEKKSGSNAENTTENIFQIAKDSVRAFTEEYKNLENIAKLYSQNK